MASFEHGSQDVEMGRTDGPGFQDVGMADEDDESMDSLDASDDESLFVPGKILDPSAQSFSYPSC